LGIRREYLLIEIATAASCSCPTFLKTAASRGAMKTDHDHSNGLRRKHLARHQTGLLAL
jgi:hypothetical protein